MYVNLKDTVLGAFFFFLSLSDLARWASENTRWRSWGKPPPTPSLFMGFLSYPSISPIFF